MKTQVVSVPANTAFGSQVIRTPNFGVPTLAIIMVMENDAGPALSFGCVDGTRQRVSSSFVENLTGGGFFSGATYGANDKCVAVIDSSGSTTAEASFVQFVQDGIEITWGFPWPATAYTIVVTLFSGVTARVGNVKAPFAKNSSYDETGFSFEPKSILFFGNGQQFDSTARVGDVIRAFGFVNEDLENFSAATYYYAQNSPGSVSAAESFISDSFVHQSYTQVAQGPSVELSAFLADGFTVTTRTFAGQSYLGYIALDTPCGGRIVQTPIVTGVDIESTSPIPPTGGILVQVNSQAAGVVYPKGDISVTLFDRQASATSGIGYDVGEILSATTGEIVSGGPKMISGDGSVTSQGTILKRTNQTFSVDYSAIPVAQNLWLLVIFPDDPKHFRKIEDACRTSFDVLVSTPNSLAVQYPNAPSALADSEMHVEFETSDQVELRGRSSLFATSGSLKAKLFAPLNEGDGSLLEIADEIYLSYMNLKEGIVLFRQPRARRVGISGSKYEVEVEIPFYASEEIPVIFDGALPLLDTMFDCAATVRTRLAAEFPSVFVAYDNAPNENIPGNLTWVQIQVIPGTTAQVQLNTRRVFGRADVIVYASLDSGTLDALVLIDEIAEQFRAVTLSGVQFRTPAIVSSRRDRGFWRIVLSCPYFFEEATNV